MNTKTSTSTTAYVWVTVLVLVPCAIALAIWMRGCNGPPPPPPPNGPATLAAEARKLQTQGKLDAARAKWTELRDTIDKSDEPERSAASGLRDEAARNLALLAKPAEPVSEDEVVEVPAPATRPEKVEAKTLQSYYPKGRKLQSEAYLQVEGTGSNEEWFFKTNARFLYNYRVTVETVVEQNDGTVLVFQQRFPEVVQERASWDSTVRVGRIPPLVRAPFEALEREVLKRFPVYVLIRGGIRIASLIDPQAERLLTGLRDRLKAAGLVDEEKMELAFQIEKLQGTTLRLRYVSGLGVTQVEILQGLEGMFSDTDLHRIAHGSSLLMDYFIAPDLANHMEGEEWEVDASDVASLINLYDAEVSGKLELRLDGRDDRETTLRIVGGQVVARGEGRQSVTLKDPSGTVQYDHRNLFVRDAEAQWEADTFFESERHLLFGTKRVANLQMKTVYRARRVDDAKPASDVKEAVADDSSAL